MSQAPLRILGLGRGEVEVGAPADLVIFDPVAEWTAEVFHSRSENSPWRGRRLVGKVRATVADGAVVYREGDQ
jgi:dihydroorotase